MVYENVPSILDIYVLDYRPILSQQKMCSYDLYINLTKCAIIMHNQLTLKCTTPTPLVLNPSPGVTTPLPDRQSLWLDLINISDYAKFHQNIAANLSCVASWNLGAKCPETGFF